MKNSALFALWGGMFALCAGLGFIPKPEGALGGLLTALAVASFLPPLWLIRRASVRKDRRTLALIRNLSLLSLILTSVLLIANFLAATASEILGNILHYILVIVSSPMVCSGYWALSLFLWACLMVASISALKKM